MIALVDYGAGNLASVCKALAVAGTEARIARDPGELADASGVIVPGVGHFQATAAIDDAWREGIVDRLGNGRPLFGICLGMQWLFEGSAEAPDQPGLGVLAGICTRLAGADESGVPLKVPHVGWNLITRCRQSRLLEGVPDTAYVYFTHSYAAPVTPETVAATVYGETFASAVERGQVWGVQFHPEKSGEAGLQILRNFVGFAESG